MMRVVGLAGGEQHVLCTLGLPGAMLPSSATSASGVPTSVGTCVREPALTRRTSTLPELWKVPGTSSSPFSGIVRSK